ncbi:unnamed protein product [Choristocarpus tenellus]
MYKNNEGVVKLSGNPINGFRTKHIDVRHHFLKQLVSDKIIEVVHVVSEE